MRFPFLLPLTITLLSHISVNSIRSLNGFIENEYKPRNYVIADGNIPFYKRLLQLFPNTENVDEFALDHAIKSGNISTVPISSRSWI